MIKILASLSLILVETGLLINAMVEGTIPIISMSVFHEERKATMKNVLMNHTRLILVAIPLMILLFQIFPPVITAGGGDSEFYITGSQLVYGLRALHVIDKVKGDETAPYDYKAYYKYDSKNKKLSKTTKLEYLNN